MNEQAVEHWPELSDGTKCSVLIHFKMFFIELLLVLCELMCALCSISHRGYHVKYRTKKAPPPPSKTMALRCL